MQNILFVCTGNICRSPTAEGVFRRGLQDSGLASLIACDSAGTHGYHIGEPPDKRSIRAAGNRGVDIATLRARKVTPEDFQRFDVILGLDAGHVAFLRRLAPASHTAQVELFMRYAGLGDADIPDPYYGGPDGFETVLDMLEEGVQSILNKLKGAA